MGDGNVEYVPMIRDLAEADRPRERLLQVGPQAVSTAELLAIILRTGTGGENVLRLAERLLAHFTDLTGLAQATIAELQSVKGIGPAKAIEIKAALEIGRRIVPTTDGWELREEGTPYNPFFGAQKVDIDHENTYPWID